MLKGNRVKRLVRISRFLLKFSKVALHFFLWSVNGTFLCYSACVPDLEDTMDFCLDILFLLSWNTDSEPLTFVISMLVLGGAFNTVDLLLVV